MEYISPTALGQSGLLTEALIRQLFVMETFPEESGPYIYFETSRSTLRGAPLYLIFFGFLSVFFAASYFVGGRNLDQKIDGWKRALPHYLGVWLPLVAGVLLLYFFVEVGIMVKYEAYPATTKDPLMLNPDWTAVILFLIGLGIFFILARWLVRRFTAGHHPQILVR